LAKSSKQKQCKNGRAPARELLEVVPEFVSLVDRPANEREFLLYKRKEGGEDKTKKSKDKTTGGEGMKVVRLVKASALPEGSFNTEWAIKNAMMSLGAIAGVGGDPWDMTALSSDALKTLKNTVSELGKLVGFPKPTNKSKDALEKSVEEIMESLLTEPVEKKGAKISAKRLKALEAAYKNIREVLKDAGIEVDEGVEKFFEDYEVELEIEKDDSEPAAEEPTADADDGGGDEPAADDAAPTQDEPAADADAGAEPAADEPAADADAPAPDAEPAPAADDAPPEGTPVEKQLITQLAELMADVKKGLDTVAENQEAQGERLSTLENLRGIKKGADAGDGGDNGTSDVKRSSFAKACNLPE